MDNIVCHWGGMLQSCYHYLNLGVDFVILSSKNYLRL
jgi:hypothetical protein